MPGQLFLIGTPIGNLGDLTFRAAETLRALDLLYCEDTRHTAKLLAHLGASPTTRALSDDAPDARWGEAVAEALAGKRVGFVTDAGMPGVSDPGRRLVRAAWNAGLKPTIIPGPSSVGTLLAACPFVDNTFRFAGFPPRKSAERAAYIAALAAAPEPCFLFEAPGRVAAFLDQLCAALEPARQLLAGREMTKLHEELQLFSAGEWPELKPRFTERGEFTLAVAAAPPLEVPLDEGAALAALKRLAEAGFSRRDAVRALAAAWDVSVNEIKKLSYQAGD